MRSLVNSMPTMCVPDVGASAAIRCSGGMPRKLYDVVSLPSLTNSEYPPKREPWATITPCESSVNSTSARILYEALVVLAADASGTSLVPG